MKAWIRTGLMGGLICLLTAVALVPSLDVQAQAAQTGTNWVGQFFNTTDLTGPVVGNAAYPAGINQSWPTGTPRDGAGLVVPGVNATNYSARFTSTQTLPAGNYLFSLRYDDGVRFFIDSNQLINDFTGGSARTTQVPVTLTGGQYTLKVEYVQNTAEAELQVVWFTSAVVGTPSFGLGTPGIALTFGPTATAAPIATGSVVGVNGLSVRTGPYIGATLVGVARPDTVYPIIGRNKSEGPFTWYLIQLADNKQGWSSGRYLVTAGNIEAIPFINTVFDQIDNVADVGVVGYPRAFMNLRVRPSERTARIDQVPWGDPVSIIGRTRRGGRDFWYQVRWNGKVGWILASFVSVKEGFIDAVPVR